MVLISFRLMFTDFLSYLGIVVYGFVFTLPTAIKDMGYSREQAQLLTIPIYAGACVAVLFVAYFADKTAQRFPFVCYPFILCAVCFAALIGVPKTHSPGVRYGLLFGVAAGVYAPLCGIGTSTFGYVVTKLTCAL